MAVSDTVGFGYMLEWPGQDIVDIGFADSAGIAADRDSVEDSIGLDKQGFAEWLLAVIGGMGFAQMVEMTSLMDTVLQAVFALVFLQFPFLRRHMFLGLAQHSR